MSRFWPIALVAAGALTSAGPALAQVPTLDIGPTCSAAGSVSTAPNPREACERSEYSARDELKKRWDSFAANERRRCSSLVQSGGSPSYVELLTCLQAAEAAAKLPKQGLEGPMQRIESPGK